MKKGFSILLAVSAVLFSGCIKYGFSEQEFIALGQNVSLTVGGKPMFSYNSGYHQLAYNPGRNEFRANSDSFDKFFVLSCDSKPAAAGDEVNATLTYTDTKNNTVKVKGIFRVSKVNNDNGRTLWLWNAEKKTGVVVKELNNR